MIGDPGQKNLALGFTIRKFDDLDATEKLYVGKFKDAIDTFATAVKTAIKAVKQAQRAAKADLEKQKNDRADDDNFRDYLFGKNEFSNGKGYIEQLRKIGMSAPAVMGSKGVKDAFAKLKMAVGNMPVQVTFLNGAPVAAAAVQKKDEKKTTVESCWVAGWDTDTVLGLKNKPPGKGQVVGKVQFNIPLLTIHTGIDDSYVKVADGVRDLYEKKSQAEVGGTSQYVKDDDDIFTRRYATMWKAKDVLKGLLGTNAGYLKGRFATQNGRTLPKVTDPFAPDPSVKKVQGFEAHQVPDLAAGDDLGTREMLHVHQELGSGPSGRGLCLSSISLSHVEATGGTWRAKVKRSYANSGDPFSGTDNLLVLVDLSLVPTGKELLYNLYRPEAQERAVPVRLVTNAGDFSNNAHMLSSVSKNRELYLRVLTPTFIVNWGEVEPELTK